MCQQINFLTVKVFTFLLLLSQYCFSERYVSAENQQMRLLAFVDSVELVLESDTTGVLYSCDSMGNMHIQNFSYSLENCDSIVKKACYMIVNDVNNEINAFCSFSPQDTLVISPHNEIYFKRKSNGQLLYFKLENSN